MKLDINKVMQEVEDQQRWIVTVTCLLGLREQAEEDENSTLMFGIDVVLIELGYFGDDFVDNFWGDFGGEE